MPDEQNDWRIFQENKSTARPLTDLPLPPSWRRSCDQEKPSKPDEHDKAWFESERERGETFIPTVGAIAAVNAALYLRRPLLLTGPPRVGKSTLISAVAYQLNLGPVLRWNITSR